MKEINGQNQKQCSICLNKSIALNLLKKLDCVDENGMQWSSKLQYIAPEVQEWSNDDSICDVCIQNLEVACKFKKKCLESSLKLEKTDRNDKNLISERIDEYCNNDDAYISEQETNKVAGFICYHCKDSFTLKNKLKEHIKIEHNSFQGSYDHGKTFLKKEYICNNCKRSYRTERILNIHRKKCTFVQKHVKVECNTEREVFCNECDELLNAPEKLKVHIKQEHCIESFNSFKRKGQNVRQQKTFNCEICQGKFRALKELIGHYARVHSLDKKFVKPYSCDVCTKRFRSSTNLTTHKLYHDRNRIYTCSTCGKSFITKNDLLGHEITHCNDRKFKCDKCEKSFKTNTNLRTHCLIVHTDPAMWKFSCSICTKKFPMKSSHDQHFRRHTGEKNFACTLCKKAFTSKSELQEHIRYHANLRRFKCDQCEKEYRKKTSLQVHLTKIHGIGDAKIPVKEKKHACHLCPGKFPDRVKLARHLCTHTGRKPFACTACEKKFTDKSYLKLHLKNAHNIVDVSPEILNISEIN